MDGATPWRRHELFLTTLSADGRSAIGSLVTEGHDRGEVWPVIARSTGPKRVEVVFDTTHPTAGPMPHTPYRNGDRLFTLSGSHGSPTTSLDALATLHRHPATGRYFTPIGPGDLTGATPSGS